MLDATLEQEGALGTNALDSTGQEAPPTDISESPTTAGDVTEQAGPGQDESPRKGRRELAMEEIAAKRVRDIEQETGKSLQELEDVAADDRETGLPLDRALKVKIDGEEMTVGQAELIREYQKGRTADKRLQQAADERKELEIESARLAGERAEWDRTRAAGTAAQPGGPDDDESQATPIGEDTDGAKLIYEALVSGDEDKAITAIKKLTQGRQAEAIPPETIAARVRQQISWEDAQGAFSRNYPDIIADQVLRDIASATLTETLKTSQSYEQAFQEAGDRTRAWAVNVKVGSGQAAGGKPHVEPGLADKQARKERIDNLTVISARAAGKPQDTVESPTDVIAQMRRDRGQPT